MSGELSGETDGVFDSNTIDYFFELRVDKQIPIADICQGISNLKSKDIFGDFEIECPDRTERLRSASIYSSPVTQEDIEECLDE
jgi:hypothetical protein